MIATIDRCFAAVHTLMVRLLPQAPVDADHRMWTCCVDDSGRGVPPMDGIRQVVPHVMAPHATPHRGTTRQ